MSGPLGEDLGVEIPDVPEPIRAYRWWTLQPSGLSSYRGTRWPTDTPLDAACLTPRDTPCRTAPSPTSDNHYGHGCGIYAYNSIAALIAGEGAPNEHKVYGEVLLWGRVFEHEHGYRAEHAQIACLYRQPGDGPLPAFLALIAGQHGVELVDMPVNGDEYDQAVERHQQAAYGPVAPGAATCTPTGNVVITSGSSAPLAGFSHSYGYGTGTLAAAETRSGATWLERTVWSLLEAGFRTAVAVINAIAAYPEWRERHGSHR